MKTYVILGTGTDIGKTFFTTRWIRKLRQQGKRVTALKPVISGFDEQNLAETDTGLLLAAQGLALTPENINAISPWQYRLPISPDMAAQAEGKILLVKEVIAFCQQERECDILLIEGAGGVMSPMGKGFTMLEVIKHLNCEVVLVGGSYLGAISHILTSYHSLLAQGIFVKELVINESAESPVKMERMLSTLNDFLPNRIQIISRM